MRIVFRISVFLCLVCYIAIWLHYKKSIVWSDFYLSSPMPAPVVETFSGYGQHMAAFALFVKASIFIGGDAEEVEEEDYADSLAQHFEVMTRLYPEFIDPYHFSQSFLAYIAPEYAKITNKILDRAISEYPDSIYYPFFKAFNYYQYLDQPVEAGKIFAELAEYPEAPVWFKSLSSKLMARGGQLQAGREMVAVLYLNEMDPAAKERYREQLENFDAALQVQQLLDQYRDTVGQDAQSLNDLVPEYLQTIPKLNDGYLLEWDPPILKILPPARVGAKQ